MENRHTVGDLRQMQSLPLSAKIMMTRHRIRECVEEFGEDGICVSFSGGKDSSVLLDIVRKDYPNVKAVFVNTGLEYPSVRRFALSKENVTELRPTMNFLDVICKYGYPVIGKEVSRKIYEARKCIAKGNTNTLCYRQVMGLEKKRNGEPSEFNIDHYKYLLNAPFMISDNCCEIMKKKPMHKYANKNNSVPIIGIMAEESRQRRSKWIKHGCNAFDLKHPESNPISFWAEQDILTYIHIYDLAIAEAYGQVVRDWDKEGLVEGQIDYYEKLSEIIPNFKLPNHIYKTTGCKRTGCIFCMFGINQDKNRFIRLADQEPKLCDYVMRGGEFGENEMWQPSKNGLGYWFVIEWLNVHGNLKIGMPDREKYLEEYQTEETRKYLFIKG